MSDIAVKQIHDDLVALRAEVRELRECFHEDFLELMPDIIKAVREARLRMKDKFVSHEEMRKEFLV